MLRRSFVPAAAILAVCLTSPTRAEETLSPIPAVFGDEAVTVRGFTENDGSLYNPVSKYDRHYTSGQGMAFMGRPDWLAEATRDAPFADVFGDTPAAEPRIGGGLSFAWRIFTPHEISPTAPNPDDMPFAGHYAIGGFWQRETELADNPGVRVLEHVELDLGMLGPAARGRGIQRWIHDHIAGRANAGWVNQLRDEPTAQLLLRRKWVLDQSVFGARRQRDYQWELIPDAALNLGTIDQSVSVGCEGRFGVNLPRDFGTPRLDDMGTPGCDWSGTLPGGAPRRGDSFYVFLRGEGKLVAHDTFTDGSLIHDAPTLAGANIHGRPVRGSLSAGFRWCWDLGRARMEFGYALTLLSPLYREDRKLDSFGSFRFGTTFRF